MKIIEPNFEIMGLEQEREPLKKIEQCGRICYQSTHKIEDGSYKKFIDTIMKNGHYSVMEHGNIILEMDEEFFHDFIFVVNSEDLKYFKISKLSRKVISGNFRAWLELTNKYNNFNCVKTIINLLGFTYPECFNGGILNTDVFNIDLLNPNGLTEEEFNIHARITVKLIVDRGFLAEIRTHRDASFSAESTRYCNYADGKFSSQITVIRPFFFEPDSDEYSAWYKTCSSIESMYNYLILQLKRTPQEARTILPNSLKCEIVMTANIDEWKHIFELRTGAGAHPQMKQVIVPLEEKFKEIGYI